MKRSVAILHHDEKQYHDHDHDEDEDHDLLFQEPLIVDWEDNTTNTIIPPQSPPSLSSSKEPFILTTAAATPSCFGDWLANSLAGPEGVGQQKQKQQQQPPTTTPTKSLFGGCGGGIIDSCGGGGGGRSNGRSVTPDHTNELHKTETEDATTEIAKEMNRLSLQEREKIYEEIHGVSDMIQETPEFISRSYTELEHYIQSTIPSKDKVAYELASSLEPEYTQDIKLRLAFLRDERFIIPVAAKAFVGWWDWKLELFGKDKLCKRHITMNDLSDNARISLGTGVHQILPARDSCGRVVVATALNYRGSRGHNPTAHDILQAFWYSTMSLVDDETNQHSGYVWINYMLESEKGKPDTSGVKWGEFYWKNTQMHHCIPLRLEAMHYLVTNNNGIRHHPVAILAKTVSSYVRARFRVHVGSTVECEYALLGFGVPVSLIPVSDAGELKTKDHKKWIQRRLVKDQEFQKAAARARHHHPSSPPVPYVFPGIELPSRADILLGKGKPIQDHPGNQRLRELVQLYLEEYNTTAKDGGRTIVAKRIMNELRSPSSSAGGWGGINNCSGGRFLKPRNDPKTSGWWEEELDEAAIVDKVCNGFRNLRLHTKRSTKKSTTTTTNGNNDNTSRPSKKATLQ